MEAVPLPMLLFGVLYLGFLGFVAFSHSRWPQTVATHFDFSGRPNRWMSRSSLLLSLLIFGTAFPLFVVALCWLTRFVPVNNIKIPHRDYWLSSQRSPETFGYLFAHSWWFACAALCFVLGLYHQLLRANQTTPPPLASKAVLLLAGAFLAATGLWLFTLFDHFSQPA